MKFFVDSSIIIETLKGNKNAKDIFDLVYNLENVELFINQTVISEVTYNLSYKRKFKLEEIREFLLDFFFLSDSLEVIEESFLLMKIYNLKPNDALILATCKHYNIPYLLSLDEDFKEACEKEGIVLIDSVEELKKVLNKSK